MRYIVIFVSHALTSTNFVSCAVDLSPRDNNSMCEHHDVALCYPRIHSMAIFHTRTRYNSRRWLLVSYPRINDATPRAADYHHPIGRKSPIAHPAVVLDMGFHRNELQLCSNRRSDLPPLFQRTEFHARICCLCHAKICRPANCPHCKSFVVGHDKIRVKGRNSDLRCPSTLHLLLLCLLP